MMQHTFRYSLRESKTSWTQIMPTAISPTERYSHCACFFDKSMYVFGGCTLSNTTFNDLWRFDLATRQWIRPLAMGLFFYIIQCLHVVDPLSYFSFQPVLHDWCNKGHGMCYPVCGMVHIKEPLLLIDKSSICGGSGFPFSLSEWSLTICLMPYIRR